MEDKVKLFKCRCCHPDHSVIAELNYWDEKNKEDKDLFLYVQLTTYHSLWSRLKASFKYLFKMQNTHFDECLLSKDHAKELQELLKEYLGE